MATRKPALAADLKQVRLEQAPCVRHPYNDRSPRLRVAVKVIDPRGNEGLRVVTLSQL